MIRLPSSPSDTTKRRQLRREAPRAERILWPYLRNRHLNGYKFRRQHSAGRFVLDFYCPERGLAIEIDGPTHQSPEARAYDTERQHWIESFGVTFQRFSNWEVYNRREGVLVAIEILLDTLEDLQSRPGAAKYPPPRAFSWSTAKAPKSPCPSHLQLPTPSSPTAWGNEAASPPGLARPPEGGAPQGRRPRCGPSKQPFRLCRRPKPKTALPLKHTNVL